MDDKTGKFWRSTGGWRDSCDCILCRSGIFFQNIDDAESRKIYGVAAILSVGFLLALMQYVWGEQLGKLLPGEINTQQEIFWTVWYLFVIAMLMMGTFRAIRQQRQKKVKLYKTVLFSLIMGVLLCATLWQYQGTIQR